MLTPDVAPPLLSSALAAGWNFHHEGVTYTCVHVIIHASVKGGHSVNKRLQTGVHISTLCYSSRRKTSSWCPNMRQTWHRASCTKTSSMFPHSVSPQGLTNVRDTLTLLQHPSCMLRSCCTPGGAPARLPSSTSVSRSARAGSLPRIAACAGSARAGRSSRCTWRVHTAHGQHTLIGSALPCNYT